MWILRPTADSVANGVHRQKDCWSRHGKPVNSVEADSAEPQDSSKNTAVTAIPGARASLAGIATAVMSTLVVPVAPGQAVPASSEDSASSASSDFVLALHSFQSQRAGLHQQALRLL